MAQETITLKLTIDGQQAEKLLASLGLKGKTSGDQVGAGMGQARKSIQGLQTDLARAGLAIEGVQRIYGLLGQSVRPFLDAAREQVQAQQVLRGTSRLLGTSYEDLVGVADQINDRFRIGTQASNGMAAELAKLESQAGTSGQSVAATGAILDLAAARGFTSAEAMQAVQQAMLGIDEGTDKLFGKNPSGLWADYAVKIGTTAGKLTDAQKQQALLDAIMTEGAKVQGEYGRMMDGPIGASQDLAVATRELQAAGGQLTSEVAAPLIRHLADLAGAVNSLPEPVRRAVGGAAMLTGGLIALRLAGITPTMGSIARMPAVLRLARVQLVATGATAAGPVSVGFRAAGIAVKGFWASLGPIGWAILGITALAEVVALLTGNKGDATAASEEHSAALAKEAEAFRALSLDELAEKEKAVADAKRALTAEVRTQQTEVARLRDEWQDLVRAQMRSKLESTRLPDRTALEAAENDLAASRTRLTENTRQEAALATERARREKAEADAKKVRDQAAAEAATRRRAAEAKQAVAEAKRRAAEAKRRADEARAKAKAEAKALAEAQAALRLEIEGEVAARRSSLERQALDLERWYAEQKKVAGAMGQLRTQLDAEYTARQTAMYRAAANERVRTELDLQAQVLRFNGATDAEIIDLHYAAVAKMFDAAVAGSEEAERLRVELLRLSTDEAEAIRADDQARREAAAAEASYRAAEIEVAGAARAAALSGTARVAAEEATEAELARLRLAALQARLAAQETYAGMTVQQTRAEAARLREAIVREQARIVASSRKTAQAVADDVKDQMNRVLEFTEDALGTFWGQMTVERRRRSDEEVSLDRERFTEQRAQLDEQLRGYQLTREEHSRQMREIALAESDYEAGLAEERESRIRRGAKETAAFLARESGAYLVQLARDKVLELAVHTTTEEGKTVVSLAGTAARVAGYIAEQAAALYSAGASMVSAAAGWIAAAVKKLGLFALVAAPVGLGALYGMYRGAKAAFGFEGGGFFGRPGESARDEPVVGLGRGEAVLTRHQQGPVNRALKLVYGTDLGGLFAAVRTPHWASGADLMSAAGLPPGTPVYDTGGFTAPVSGASSGASVDMSGMERQFGQLIDVVRRQQSDIERMKREPVYTFVGDAAARQLRNRGALAARSATVRGIQVRTR